MTTKTRLPADEIIPIAHAIKEILAPLTDRIEIAGSIRRKRDTVGDIEIVCIPKRATLGFGQVFDDEVRSYLAECAARADHWDYRLNTNGRRIGFGSSNAFMTFTVAGRTVPVDLFFASPDTWGTVLFVRTGPADFIKSAASRARRMGMKLLPYVGFEHDNGRGHVWCREEREVFEALSFPWIKPEDRDDGLAKEMRSVFSRSA